MSMDVLFRCNMDAVLRQIFLWLDPESLHRARQVCQQWEQFIMDRVWARMETRLVRNWLSGEPSVVVEEYRGLVPRLWGLIAMDSQLVIVWPEQEGPRVMERNSGRILATIPKLSDKKVCFSRCSVGISDHFIMVKSDHNQMVGVFARPSIESSQDGTSPPELPLLGSIDLKPHRIGREDESDVQSGEFPYDIYYLYSRTRLIGLGKSHVVTGSSIAPSYPTMVWKLEEGKFILAKTFCAQANDKPNFAVDGGRLLVVEHEAQPGFARDDQRKRFCNIHDSKCITHGWLRIFNADNLDKEEYLVETDLAYFEGFGFGSADYVETLAFKFPLVAVYEAWGMDEFVKVWNAETGLKLIQLDMRAWFDDIKWHRILQLHFVKNLLVIQLHDESSDSIKLGLIDTDTSDENPVASLRVFDQIRCRCSRPKLWFDDTSVSYFSDGYRYKQVQDPKKISSLIFWC